jgi:hypothetical protein
MKLTRTMQLTKLRLASLAPVVVAASILAMTTQATASPATTYLTRSDGGAKPVIVLEHGAWADASGWSKVIQRL